MKTIRLIFIYLWCLAYMAFAERSLSLSWDPNPAGDMVTGYAVIVDGRELPPVTGTTATVTIPDTLCKIELIAINLGGKSAPTAPLMIPASPSNPKGLRVTAILRTTVSTP